MNQTQKRLSIINLAISITDIETIQLQILKLGLLKTDSRIQEIISVLQAENYAKAQRLIKTYIETPVEEIVQRASQEDMFDFMVEQTSPETKHIISEEDQKIIDEFQLFMIDDDNSSGNEKRQQIDIHEYLYDSPKSDHSTPTNSENDFDVLLQIEADDVMPDNIAIDLKQDKHDSFFDIPEKQSPTVSLEEDVQRDTFFDTVDEPTSENTPYKDPFDSLLSLETESPSKATVEDNQKSTQTDPADILHESSKPKKHKKRLTDTQIPKPRLKKDPEEYPPISYIRQKYVSMRKQYEPIQKGNERFSSIQTFLTTISQDGYREEDIEKSLLNVQKLTEEEKFSEAAQLLLVCASTESRFAQFMLARELYKGVLLRKKVSEAFNILTHMADDKYPEAICDLGQFYENGIGTSKNKKIAQELYKEAMDLGIKRAQKHFERLKKENKGFFTR